MFAGVIFSILMISILCILSADSQRGKFNIIPAFAHEWEGYQVFLTVGQPPQLMSAALDPDKTELIIMDEQCRGRLDGPSCPRYCQNVMMKDVTDCPITCDSTISGHNNMRCTRWQSFISKDSSTFKDLQTEHIAHFHMLERRSERLYGKKAKEVIGIGKRPNGRTTSAEINFVRGLLFDRGLLGGVASIVGLAPSATEPNFVQQLHQKSLIGTPAISILSIIQRKRSLVVREGKDLREIVTVGAVDKASCAQWRYDTAEAAGVAGWTFRMEEVSFGGTKVVGRNVGRIALDSYLMAVPVAVVTPLLASGVIRRAPRGIFDEAFEIKPEASITLDFTADGIPIRLQGDDLVANSGGLGWPLAGFMVNAELRFTDEAHWTFGTNLLKRLCYGYDYRTNRTMLGDRRRGYFL